MAWSDIKGHERWVNVFAHVARQKRLAHAYLFVGPAGIGKRLFALELAKTLLCEGRVEHFAACGQCESCILFDARTHPDFFEVGLPEDGNVISIEAMVELCRNFSLKSARGKGKVALLDDADAMNEESSNCFLKTLEEPPPGSVFILLSNSGEAQMATIRSRCQMVRFAPLPQPEVVEVLRRQGCDPALIGAVAHMAAGSPGQALALADPDLWQFRQTLLAGLVKSPLEASALGKLWTQFAEDAGKETAPQRRRAALVLRLLIEFLGQALEVSLGAEPRTQVREDQDMLRTWSERTGSDKILALLERALVTERQLERYIQVSLVLEALLDSFGQLLDARVPARA